MNHETNRPSWWTEQDQGAWDRAREAVRRDWDQTLHDLHLGGHELNQSVVDTFKQAGAQEPMPPIDKANPPKVIGNWDDAELAIGYGYAARNHFGDKYPQWDDDLERTLKDDWRTDKPWSAMRLFVRHGYEVKR